MLSRNTRRVLMTLVALVGAGLVVACAVYPYDYYSYSDYPYGYRTSYTYVP